MYSTASTRMRPLVRKYDRLALSAKPTPRPTASDSARLARIALVGVRYLELTLPNHFGNVPVSPILNQIRVETLLHAWQTARVELNMAASTNTHAAPQMRWAMARPGRSGEFTSRAGFFGLPVRMLVPQPMI